MPIVVYFWLCLMLSIQTFAVEASMVPVDQEVCFAPDEACDQKLVEFIKSAKVSLDIAIYDVNLDELVHQILVLSKKIKVRLIVDKMQSRGKHSAVSTLFKGGVQIRFGHQRGIMHNKFAIVDGKMLETGSFNYTHHAAQANQENQIYMTNPAVIKRFNARFEKIWETGKIFSP